MKLGEKLLLARQEAGLTQRQLCGEEITRNMLSQIEHGTAQPSMGTLRYLAGRLGKPVSYFLEEDAVISPNQDSMLQARAAYQEGKTEEARLLLENFQSPDPIFEWEYRFLRAMTTLAAAETAIAQGKDIYARELLTELEGADHGIPGVERQRLLLLGQVRGQNPVQVSRELPSIDEDLLLRARAALKREPKRAGQLLDAMEDRTDAGWYLLRGHVWLKQREYALAAECFHRAEEGLPGETAPLLERCYRELGDYKRAYEYALKQR